MIGLYKDNGSAILALDWLQLSAAFLVKATRHSDKWRSMDVYMNRWKSTTTGKPFNCSVKVQRGLAKQHVKNMKLYCVVLYPADSLAKSKSTGGLQLSSE